MKRATAEFLGKGLRAVGGAQCTSRRLELLHRYASLGDGLSLEQKANFTWFKTEWDRRGKETHGDDWPDLFLGKLKGVLDKLYTDPTAFSRFVFDEEREVFKDTKALVVPGSIRQPLSITQG